MIKRMVLMLLALAVIIGGLFGWKYYQGMLKMQQMAAREQPATAVTTTVAEGKTWQPTLKAVGGLRAVDTVAVSPAIAGRVMQIRFQSGQRVSAGKLLVALNTATEQAEVDRLQAQRDLAESRLQRRRRLLRQDQTSQEAVDEAAAEVESLKAQLRRERSLIEKKRIRAPFDGVLGIRQVDQGQYVSPGDRLVTLQNLDPLYVDFDLPQERLAQVSEGTTVTLAVDSHPDRSFEGTISAIDPQVAQETRNFAVRATVPNDHGLLRPGMFAQTAVRLPERRDVVTLPKTAITSNPYGDSIFVVEEPEGKGALTVTKRFVTTGDRRGDQVAVTEGLAAGETVVTSGQLKLSEGARIEANNEVQPANDPDPRPVNK
ncbi:efflux RND transporter periplasmic adaptor subunit [Thiohalorhabdus sp.]|uniref:efflux RND transporter periplasmic adaptor subunit n=1 Tax=Thiohalorhabdus sp. TaxID=3094134 RepID=UPI002FC2C1CE